MWPTTRHTFCMASTKIQTTRGFPTVRSFSAIAHGMWRCLLALALSSTNVALGMGSAPHVGFPVALTRFRVVVLLWRWRTWIARPVGVRGGLFQYRLGQVNNRIRLGASCFRTRCDETRSLPKLVEARSHVAPDNSGSPILPYKCTGPALVNH